MIVRVQRVPSSRRSGRSAVALLVALASGILTGVPATAPAATFSVTSTADQVDATPGNGTCATLSGTCTLRAAIQEANALSGPDTIELGPGPFVLSLRGADEDAAATGDLDLLGEVVIEGPPSATAVIDGADLDRVFDVLGPSNVTLRNLTVYNGTTTAPGLAGSGGGVRVAGALRAERTTIVDNVSGSADGGGVAVVAGGSLELAAVTVLRNEAAADGGGLAVLRDATANLANTTVSENFAAAGGGVFVELDATADLTNVTLQDNSAGQGSAILNLETCRLANTIVAGTDAVGNCSGKQVVSRGSNLDSGLGCALSQPTDIGNTSPLLGPLTNNGGPTLTYLPGPGSPVIDLGDDTNCPPTDQRGVPRPQDGNEDGTARCDIGAVEVGGPATPTPTPSGSATVTMTPTATQTPVTPTPDRAFIDIGSATGLAGERVSFGVVLRAEKFEVGVAQVDITFDPVNAPVVALGNGTPDCTVNAALGKIATFDYRPSSCTSVECTTVRAGLFGGVESIADGSTLFTCAVAIAIAAAPGTYGLTGSTVVLGAVNGDPILAAIGTDGSVIVVLPTATPTATPTETPTETPTVAPSATPVRCAGDCADVHAVAVDNILTMINIADLNAPPSTCAAGDARGDGTVTHDDILAAVANALHGCPATPGKS